MSTQKILKEFEIIYKNTYNKILKYVICKCSNLDDVNDIIQETYIEFYKKLKELINKRNPNCLIQVDGGVNDKNIHALKDAGVDVVVAGSYVFGNDDYSKAIKSLQV